MDSLRPTIPSIGGEVTIITVYHLVPYQHDIMTIIYQRYSIYNFNFIYCVSETRSARTSRAAEEEICS